MKRINYKINDIEASISHNKQWLTAYEENINTLKQCIKDKTIDIVQWENWIKELQEDKEIDIYFLELLEWVRLCLLSKL